MLKRFLHGLTLRALVGLVSGHWNRILWQFSLESSVRLSQPEFSGCVSGSQVPISVV